MSRRILINADDFGWTDGHNLAIARAHQLGGVHRTSLLSNGLGFSQAVDLAFQLPGLDIGVHLALNELPPLLRIPEVIRLTNGEGLFNESIFALLRYWLQRKLPIDYVGEEWDRQIEKVVKAGIRINHLDTHKHVHVIPPLSALFCNLALKYQVSEVRVPLDKFSLRLGRGIQGAGFWFLALCFRRVAKGYGLSFPGRFIGIYDSGQMSKIKLIKAIQSIRFGTTEIMVHPAVISHQVVDLQKRYVWAANYQFEEEYHALCDIEVISMLQ